MNLNLDVIELLDSGKYEPVKKLTPEAIEEFEAWLSNKMAADETLKVALNFHANRVSLANEKLQEWYERETGQNMYERGSTVYTVANHEGYVHLVKLLPDKPDNG